MMGLAERKCNNNTSSFPALPRVWVPPGRSRSQRITFAQSMQVMMLLPSGEKYGHKVIRATAHTTKRGLSHLLVAQWKGPFGAPGVVAPHVPKADRSAHVPFALLPVAMPVGP